MNIDPVPLALNRISRVLAVQRSQRPASVSDARLQRTTRGSFQTPLAGRRRASASSDRPVWG